MAQAEGSRAYIGIQEETTYGSDPGAPDITLIPYSSEDIRASQNLIRADLIRRTRNASRPGPGNISVDGSITTKLFAEMGLLFKGALGSVSTAGADPYTHTFVPANSLPSFVIEKGFEDIAQYLKCNGCKIGGFSGDINQEGFFTLSFPIMGQKETPSGSPFDATPTEIAPTVFNNFDISTIEEGGASIAIVTAISGLTYDNTLNGNNFVINPSAPGIRTGVAAGLPYVSGTLEASFENLTLLNKAINSTESSLKIIWSLGDGLGSAGNESLEIYIPELIYARNSPVVESAQGITISLAFEGYYQDHADAASLKVVLKNSTATY